MPNTLAHLGVGAIASRALFRDVDAKWIYIGCIIPDIPWIIQRIVFTLVPGIDLLDLRLYAIIQASLFFCLIFGAAISLFSRSTLPIFLLLGFNCLLHLMVDAGQIKWANGVHLFAPFSWQMIHFGFFWPENILAYGLTLFGLFMVLWHWRSAWHMPVEIVFPARFRLMAAVGLLVLYLGLPFFLFHGAEQADSHYTATLRAHATRSGRPIAFDRCQYDPDTQTIRTFSGERLHVTGMTGPHAAMVSVKGRFVSADHMAVQAFHIHHRLRDASSFLGLALVSILWFTAGWKKRIR